MGSCFSKLFGGKCSGTPDKCMECNLMCNGDEDLGKTIVEELDSDGD